MDRVEIKVNIMQTTEFGILNDDRIIHQFHIENKHGLSITLINFGAAITSVRWPDGTEINLGFGLLSDYVINEPSLGVTVGRVINRIGQGKLTIDGKTYQLPCNENSVNHLHGGTGLSRVVWQATPMQKEDYDGVEFRYLSPAGEQGYPGNLEVTVFYGLNDQNVLTMEFQAMTDQTTPVNIGNHAYWNLMGAGHGTILDHELWINADFYLPTNRFNLPTGEILSVAHTPLDFRKTKRIGEQIAEMGLGYDHSFVLNKNQRLDLAARLCDPASGRALEIATTQPAVQLYTGHYLKDIRGAHAALFNAYSGVCLETQHFPDAVHHPHFPSILLKPGCQYQEETQVRFLC